jgi:transcriptional regulator ATRX
MPIKENLSMKQELSDTEQNDSQIIEQARVEPSDKIETQSQHILGSFNELFEQFVVFKRDKDDFDEKMELERVIQKDRLQILEDNFKLIKSKLEDLISDQSNNNKDESVGESDQSIECTKGRKSNILAKEKSLLSQMDDDHHNNHEESSLNLKKMTSTHNGKQKAQNEIKDEAYDDLESEKAKENLLKTMELENLVENNEGESMDEEQEEISIASLTNTTQIKVISKKAKSPTKRDALKNVEKLNDDDQDDKDIDNFLKSADRTLRSRLKPNYKYESENELETKNGARKNSSKEEHSDHENEGEEEECDDEKSSSSQQVKEDLTLGNILNESKEKEEDLKQAMNLNSDLIDSLEENSENVEEKEEEDEDEESEKKRKKEKNASDEKPSASKLTDEGKKSKLNLKVPSLCISDSSSDDDETKKEKDEKKTKVAALKEEEEKEEETSDDVVTMKSEKKQKETKAKSSKSDFYSDEDDENEKIHVRKPTTRKSKLQSDSEESIISLNDEESSSESNQNKNDSESEKETSKKRKRIKLKSSESESESGKKSKKTKKQVKKKGKNDESDDDVVALSDEEDAIENSQSRQKLRKIIGDEKLTEETKNALAEERERKKRIEEKRRLEKEAIEKADSERIVEDVYLDIDSETKKPIIAVDKSIVKFLKDHQIEGVKFLWDSCFEKVDLIKKDHKGSGCILAHCMGLGKTLTTITLVHTVLAHKELTRVNRVLIMVPVNVLNNWKNEIHQWTGKCKKKIDVYEMPTSASGGYNLVKTRLNELERWFNKGGVFLIGYQIFQILIAGRNIKPKKAVETFKKYLTDPGPDLIVCDEGHFLKNEQTGLSKAVTQVATRRRIALTGTPLQNNLVEYHCMVSFVKPNLLGNIKEFRNRFVNPINNGQHKNSTDSDVRYMKKRAHVLNNALDGVVHRKDYSYFKACLPPKLEYVLSIRLSSKQIELYRAYLKHGGLTKLTSDFKMQNGQLFTDFQELSRVWTHPWVLKLNEVRQIRNEEKRDEDDFVTEGESDASESEASGGDDDKKSESKSNEHVISDEDTKSKDDDDDDIMEIEPSGRRVYEIYFYEISI